MEIKFDSDKQFYISGESIKGTITLKVKEPTLIYNLKIKCNLSSSYSMLDTLTNNKGKHTNKYVKYEVYNHTFEQVITHNNTIDSLYSWSFEFKLPDDLLPTFFKIFQDFYYVCLGYNEIICEIFKNGSTLTTTKLFKSLNKKFICNKELSNINFNVTKTYNSDNFIVLNCFLDNNIYRIGDNIPIYIKLDNSSKKNIKAFTISLYQLITLKSPISKLSYQKQIYISSQSYNNKTCEFFFPIRPHTEFNGTLNYKLPFNLVESINNPWFDLTYILVVEANIKWSLNLLCQSTINLYS